MNTADITIVSSDNTYLFHQDIYTIKNLLPQFQISVANSIDFFNNIHTFCTKLILVLYDTNNIIKNNLLSIIKCPIIDNFDGCTNSWKKINDVIYEIKKSYSQFINNSNILIISEDYPGFGGYGTYSYNLYKMMQKYNTKLLYLCHDKLFVDKISKLNDKNVLALHIDGLNDFIYFGIRHINKNNNRAVSIKKFLDSNKMAECYTVISISPVSLVVSEICTKYCNHYYRSGFIRINERLINTSHNFWNISSDTYNKLTYHDFPIDLHLKNKYIQFIPNSPLVEHYEKEFVVKKNRHANLVHSYFIGLNYNFKKYVNVKKYDLIFVVSRLDRSIKNFKLVNQIFLCYPKLKKILIGKGSLQYNNIYENTLCFDNLSNDETRTYISKTKILLLPSLLDAGPSVFLEAILSNCIPLVSRNTGFTNILKNIQGDHKFTLDTYELDEWKLSIEYNLISFDYILSNFDHIFSQLYFMINESISRFFNIILYPMIEKKDVCTELYSVIVLDESYNRVSNNDNNIIFVNSIQQIYSQKLCDYAILLNIQFFEEYDKARLHSFLQSILAKYIFAKKFIEQDIMIVYKDRVYNSVALYVFEKNNAKYIESVYNSKEFGFQKIFIDLLEI